MGDFVFFVYSLKKSFKSDYKFIIMYISDEQVPSSDHSSCSMVGLTGILIQIGLGVLSFSVLIIKRFRQKPKRPWKIWTFDTSKQIISQLIAHFINLTISIALTYDDSDSDECLWYFITNIFDNTIGVLICVVTLRLVEKRLIKTRKLEFVSGNYYAREKVNSQNYSPQKNTFERQEKPVIDLISIEKQSVTSTSSTDKGTPKKDKLVQEDERQNKMQAFQIQIPQIPHQPVVELKYTINYKAWLIQLLIWNAIVVMAKCVLFGLQFALKNPLKNFSFLILGWIEAYPVLQLVLVIVIVPVIMNGFAFWVQDNFLMKKETQAQGEQLLEQNSENKQTKSDVM